MLAEELPGEAKAKAAPSMAFARACIEAATSSDSGQG